MAMASGPIPQIPLSAPAFPDILQGPLVQSQQLKPSRQNPHRIFSCGSHLENTLERPSSRILMSISSTES
jgi:hypothetical protein